MDFFDEQGFLGAKIVNFDDQKSALILIRLREFWLLFTILSCFIIFQKLSKIIIIFGLEKFFFVVAEYLW